MEKTISQKELVELIGEKLPHTDNGTIGKVVDALKDVMMEQLVKGNEIRLTGLFTVRTRTRHSRGGVNPQNPTERISIPEVRVAKFKTGATLKDALKSAK